ncbi:glycoside hydrolase family 3 protein [Ferrimonas sediminicola]|uniref:beta-N-acetylhexosaminidase n=1 Tax=Ferrimonas sediminicola TaxID=2569538 RepID=A0A4U1BAU9_9GAMM|nr:glycoside hydrolase family 3 protein [Ferrimonas sediminicola]TKB47978.1 glycoside hydrolase family 3 protein [Ferrimonas sediminicola]
MTLEQQIPQKLMIDLRYFGDDPDTRTPMTRLPAAVAEWIARHGLGGVILFSDNLQSPAQIRALTSQLQQAAACSPCPRPLLISVDQEGGRVCRTPREHTTAFAGNMALGAAEPSQPQLAAEVASVMGRELAALGINVNHAPCVDVNNNPQNPVINVRAYGDDPDQVARLGLAQVRGLEAAGVLATLKHFPGHGDTHSDSHTGLPRVDHDRAHLDRVELAPYRTILRQVQPAMVMTAHIQYPALDSTTLTGLDGRQHLVPATLSRRIITDLLRQELGYQGVVITDALDMAGISGWLDLTEAVIHAFAAGVDIALMPVRIRCEEDLAKLERLVAAIREALTGGRLDGDDWRHSLARIGRLKARLPSVPALSAEVLGCESHRQLERRLASAAITELCANTLPKPAGAHRRWLLLLPDLDKAHALASALQELAPTLELVCASLLQTDDKLRTALDQAELVVSGFVSPRQSVAELGGMEDLAALDEQALIRAHRPRRLATLLEQARRRGRSVVHLSLRAPYEFPLVSPWCHWALASFAYHLDRPGRGTSYDALARVLLGLAPAPGRLPLKEIE